MDIFKWLSETRPGREGYMYQPSRIEHYFNRLVLCIFMGVFIFFLIFFVLVGLANLVLLIGGGQ